MAARPPRRRLDVELVRRGLAASRTEAQEAIAAGLVTVDGAPGLKPSTQVHAGQAVGVAAPPRTYVSRGGEKLAHGLERFAVDVSGLRCLDAGASTGGFTDCLLQHGAEHVIAVDVGYGQIHERLRSDPRVDVRERTNIRELGADDLEPPRPSLAVADVSFISLAVVLPHLRALADADASAIVLVKPQFEAARGEVGKGGVVRDPDVWRRCIAGVLDAASAVGWGCRGIAASPLLGPAGNVEFLVHLVPSRVAAAERTARDALDAAIDEGRQLRARATSTSSTSTAVVPDAPGRQEP